MPDRAALSDEQLAELLAQLPDADTVELKVTVPEEAHRSSVTALGMDPLEAQIRQVFFFDTPDLALDAAGVVVRARRVQGKGDDSVVKLRPVQPAEIAPAAPLALFGVEIDAMPGGFVCSASMKRAIGPVGGVKETVHGERPLRKLFSKEQRAFYAEHAPAGLDFEDLRHARADLRPEAQVGAGGPGAQARGRVLALPGRVAHPRALVEVPAGRDVHGRRRAARVPRRPRGRPGGRAGHEDAPGAGVLQRAPRRARLSMVLGRCARVAGPRRARDDPWRVTPEEER